MEWWQNMLIFLLCILVVLFHQSQSKHDVSLEGASQSEKHLDYICTTSTSIAWPIPSGGRDMLTRNEDILHLIASYLSTLDALRLGQTCRFAHAIATRHALFSVTLDNSPWRIDHFSTFLSCEDRRYLWLHHLTVIDRAPGEPIIEYTGLLQTHFKMLTLIAGRAQSLRSFSANLGLRTLRRLANPANTWHGLARAIRKLVLTFTIEAPVSSFDRLVGMLAHLERLEHLQLIDLMLAVRQHSLHTPLRVPTVRTLYLHRKLLPSSLLAAAFPNVRHLTFLSGPEIGFAADAPELFLPGSSGVECRWSQLDRVRITVSGACAWGLRSNVRLLILEEMEQDGAELSLSTINAMTPQILALSTTLVWHGNMDLWRRMGEMAPRMRYLELKLVEVRGKSYELDMWMANGAPLLCTVPVMAMLINICCRQCITHGHACRLRHITEHMTTLTESIATSNSTIRFIGISIVFRPHGPNIIDAELTEEEVDATKWYEFRELRGRRRPVVVSTGKNLREFFRNADYDSPSGLNGLPSP